MDSATESKSSSRLLTLPPELRNKIYAEALTYSREIWIHPSNTATRGRPENTAAFTGLHGTALLQTCSQIRKEATVISYSNNRFQITGDSRRLGYGARWLECLPVSAAASITCLNVSPPRLFTVFAFDAHPLGYAVNTSPARDPHYSDACGYYHCIRDCARYDACRVVAALERCRKKGGLKADTVKVVKEGAPGGRFYDIDLVYGRRFAKRVKEWRRVGKKKDMNEPVGWNGRGGGNWYLCDGGMSAARAASEASKGRRGPWSILDGAEVESIAELRSRKF